jgi:hypothetical protein
MRDGRGQVERLLGQLDAAWSALGDSYAGLGDAQLVEPGVVDDWSLTSSLPWKDRDSSAGRSRPGGSRFDASPDCARRLPALPPHALGRSCLPGLIIARPLDPTVPTRQPPARSAFLPRLKAGASCGGVW